MVIDPHHIYWSNFTDSTIGEANLDGSGVNQNVITGLSSPSGIAESGPVALSTTTLSAARASSAYSQTLDAMLGTAPYHWSVLRGSLPSGLTLNATTGTISGTPTAAGSSAFTVKVTDSSTPTATTASMPLTMTVAPSLQPAVFVTNGANSRVSSFALGASGNVAPLSAISGTATGLNGTSAVAIDANGRVNVASANNNEIAEFAYGATGNIRLSSVIAGSATPVSAAHVARLRAPGAWARARTDGSSSCMDTQGEQQQPGDPADREPAVR